MTSGNIPGLLGLRLSLLIHKIFWEYSWTLRCWATTSDFAPKPLHERKSCVTLRYRAMGALTSKGVRYVSQS